MAIALIFWTSTELNRWRLFWKFNSYSVFKDGDSSFENLNIYNSIQKIAIVYKFELSLNSIILNK